MAIKKLTRGYQIDFRDGDGKRHRQSFRTQREAQAALRDIQTAKERGAYVPPQKIPTLRRIGAQWLAGKAGHRTSSVVFWQTHLEGHLYPAFGDKRIDRINVAAVEKFRDQKLAEGLAPATVNKLLTTLTAVYNFAMRRGCCVLNPAKDAERAREGAAELSAGTTRRRASEPVDKAEVLDPSELKRLLESCEPGLYRTLFMTVALTGMRSGEALALQWENVDLEAGKVAVQRSLSWARRKGEDVRPRFYPPKTKAGKRTIPIPDQLRKVLRVWKLQCPPGSEDLVFPAVSGRAAHRGDILRKGLHPALERAGLRRVDMHSLRHSFASSLIAAGAPVTEVQHLLGHSSPTVTLQVYSHWFKQIETDSVAIHANTVCGSDWTLSGHNAPAIVSGGARNES